MFCSLLVFCLIVAGSSSHSDQRIIVGTICIIGHQGPLLASDPDWKGSKYNVQVEWETGEFTFEPLSIIAADDPVTCAAYAKENDLLALEGWHRFRSLACQEG